MIAEYIAASISILIAFAALAFVFWAFVTMDDDVTPDYPKTWGVWDDDNL